MERGEQLIGISDDSQAALFDLPVAASPPAEPKPTVPRGRAKPEVEALGELSADGELGYRGTTATTVAGITYRQLDYWARTKLVEPSIRAAKGSGSQRLYSFRDILVLKLVKRLLDAGVSLQNIRVAVDQLHRRGSSDLAEITLISDGTTVYECRSPEEVVDLLQGGQGVFGIAVGGAFRELEGSLAQLSGDDVGVTVTDDEPMPVVDELAARRARRAS